MRMLVTLGVVLWLVVQGTAQLDEQALSRLRAEISAVQAIDDSAAKKEAFAKLQESLKGKGFRGLGPAPQRSSSNPFDVAEARKLEFLVDNELKRVVGLRKKAFEEQLKPILNQIGENLYDNAIARTQMHLIDTTFDLNSKMPKRELVSKLAYAGKNAKSDKEAMELVKKAISTQLRALENELIPKLAPVQRQGAVDLDFAQERIRDSIKFLKSLKVEAATRDAIAVTSNGKLMVGYRGTARLGDLVPDAQIALNLKKSKRFDESLAFAKKVMGNLKIKPANVEFVGHSLGGWLAEGVKTHFVGAKATVFNPGRSLGMFKSKNGQPRAWGGKYNHKAELAFDAANNIDRSRITRVIRNGDPVSGQVMRHIKDADAGIANVFQFDRTSNWNSIKSHLLQQKADKYITEGVHLRVAPRGEVKQELGGMMSRLQEEDLRNVVGDDMGLRANEIKDRSLVGRTMDALKKKKEALVAAAKERLSPENLKQATQALADKRLPQVMPKSSEARAVMMERHAAREAFKAEMVAEQRRMASMQSNIRRDRMTQRLDQYRIWEKQGKLDDVWVSSKSMEPHAKQLIQDAAEMERKVERAARTLDWTTEYKELAKSRSTKLTLKQFLAKKEAQVLAAEAAKGSGKAVSAKGRAGRAAKSVAAGAGKTVKAVGGVYKKVYVDAPMAVVKAASPKAAAAMTKAGVAAAAKGGAALRAGGALAAKANPLGVVAQIGVSYHSFKESQKQKRQLEAALARGDIKKAKELLKKLEYRVLDLLLGKQGTKGIIDLAKMGGRGIINHVVRCAGDAVSLKKERNLGHCVGRTLLAPGKMAWKVTKAIGRGIKAGAKGVAKGVSKCWEAGAKKCASSVGDSVAKGYKFVSDGISNWFSDNKRVKEEAEKRERERKAKVQQECRRKKLKGRACERLKRQRHAEYKKMIKEAEKAAKDALKKEKEKEKAEAKAKRNKELKALFKFGKKQ